MKAVTVIFAACAFLLSMLIPVNSNPLPQINIQGRTFNSRFAPPARPVFPRSVFDNYTTRSVEPASPVKRNLPSGTVLRRNYPAGPTASALVFRSEHY